MSEKILKNLDLNESEVRLQDDFYEAVNHKWLKKAKIPNDKGSFGSFYEIHERNEKTVMNDTKEIIQLLKSKKLTDVTLKNYALFSIMANDFEKREELGVYPLVPYLKRILNIKNLNDFLEKYDGLFWKGFFLPFEFTVGQDFKNSEDQIACLGSADLILPGKSYYDPKNPAKELLFNAYRKVALQLLSFYYDDVEKNKKIIEETISFDELLAEYSPSALELANYTNLYNIYDLNQMQKFSQNINFTEILGKLITKPVDKINVYYPKFLENIDKIVNEENFQKMKSWMFLRMIFKYSSVLDEKSRLIVNEFSKALTGSKKAMKKEKAAFYLAYNKFNIPVGTYFAKRHFGEKAKKDVENMISKMIKIYTSRLFENDWLGQKTKQKAIEKLAALGIHVGYPTEIQPYFAKYEIKSYTKGGNIISNLISMNMVFSKYIMSQYKEPVNKNYFHMSPSEVNAYFNPFMNHIVFPAGILAKPFYSLSQSKSANYGGIGAVIAHEISHAFDNNGAQFDEKGNLNSWWTKEDFATFNNKAKDMIELFNNKDTEFGKCNGELTVSENIADAGGISCALEAASLEKDCDYVDFFINWAIIWRGKFKPETAKMLLANDVHAPQKLRANLQVQNLDKFYEVFNVKYTDKMWLPKAKRVKIW